MKETRTQEFPWEPALTVCEPARKWLLRNHSCWRLGQLVARVVIISWVMLWQIRAKEVSWEPRAKIQSFREVHQF